MQVQENKTDTSFLALDSASSSEETGNAWVKSEAYRFTVEMSSIIEEVLWLSLNTETSFLRMKEGGEPKSGPVPNKCKHRILG